MLSAETLEQNCEMFGGDPKNVPTHALTMGVGTVLDAKACLLLATGSSKAEILAKAVEGPVTSLISSSALQFHQHALIIADEAAAAKLTRQAHYRWVMENDPDMKAIIEEK